MIYSSVAEKKNQLAKEVTSLQEKLRQTEQVSLCLQAQALKQAHAYKHALI